MCGHECMRRPGSIVCLLGIQSVTIHYRRSPAARGPGIGGRKERLISVVCQVLHDATPDTRGGGRGYGSRSLISERRRRAAR